MKMILPRIKYFADRDYVGLGEGGREYLRAKRNKLAQDLIGARKTGNPTSNVYGLAGKERFRKEAEYIDKDLKSIVPRVKRVQKIELDGQLRMRSLQGTGIIEKHPMLSQSLS